MGALFTTSHKDCHFVAGSDEEGPISQELFIFILLSVVVLVYPVIRLPTRSILLL